MAVYRFPRPATINGAGLEAGLLAATGQQAGVVLYVDDDTIAVTTEADEAAVRQAVEAHTGEPLPGVVKRTTRRDQAVAMLNDMASKDPATWTKAQQRRLARILAVVVERVDLDPGD